MDFKETIIEKMMKMDKRRLGIILIVILVSVLILFPFIDTNFFYANRIKNRIEILQGITDLDMEKISENPYLQKEYNSIVKELSESDSNYFNKLLSNNKREHTIGKFISGGILWWLLGLLAFLFFDKIGKSGNSNEKKWKTRIGVLVVCVFLGGITGGICSFIPTIIHIGVNYTVIPILVLVLMILVFYKSSSNKDEKSS